jgi:hypothetical protein
MIPFTLNTARQENLMMENNKKTYMIGYSHYVEQLRLDSIKLEYKSEGLNFLVALGLRESSGDPHALNSYGYIGKYQFGRSALKDVGLDSITYMKFMRNKAIFPEELQDSAVVVLMKLNEDRMSDLIDKYEFTIINGIYITRAGLLAAAHLAGAGGVRSFLRSKGDYDPADGYGTKLSSYLKEFSGYNIDLAMI